MTNIVEMLFFAVDITASLGFTLFGVTTEWTPKCPEILIYLFETIKA
jgi:hypothetical protein